MSASVPILRSESPSPIVAFVPRYVSVWRDLTNNRDVHHFELDHAATDTRANSGPPIDRSKNPSSSSFLNSSGSGAMA